MLAGKYYFQQIIQKCGYKNLIRPNSFESEKELRSVTSFLRNTQENRHSIAWWYTSFPSILYTSTAIISICFAAKPICMQSSRIWKVWGSIRIRFDSAPETRAGKQALYTNLHCHFQLFAIGTGCKHVNSVFLAEEGPLLTSVLCSKTKRN